MGPGGGDNKMNEGTSFQPSEPIPCANGCGFFGTPATNNLCSKCFRDFRLKEESQVTAKVAFEKSFEKFSFSPNPGNSVFSKRGPPEKDQLGFGPPASGDLGDRIYSTPGPAILSHPDVIPKPWPADAGPPTFGADPSIFASGGVKSSLFSSVTINKPAEGEVLMFGNTGTEEKKPAVNRCGCCKKKVGVMGFACRCGITFCGTHRYPESHECSFDFKAQGREAIAKANPVVKGDKIQRF